MHIYLLVALTKHMYPWKRYLLHSRKKKYSISKTAEISSKLRWRAQVSPELWKGGQCLGAMAWALVSQLTAFGWPRQHPLPKPSPANPAPLCPGMRRCLGVCSCSLLPTQPVLLPFCTLLCSLLLLFCLTSNKLLFFSFSSWACLHSFNNSHVPTPPYPSPTHCCSMVSASAAEGDERLNVGSVGAPPRQSLFPEEGAEAGQTLMRQPVHWETSPVSKAEQILHFLPLIPSPLHSCPTLCIKEASSSWTTRFVLELSFRWEAQFESNAALQGSGCQLLPPGTKRVFGGRITGGMESRRMRHWARHKKWWLCSIRHMRQLELEKPPLKRPVRPTWATGQIPDMGHARVFKLVSSCRHS